jgi:hypothetical protein
MKRLLFILMLALTTIGAASASANEFGPGLMGDWVATHDHEVYFRAYNGAEIDFTHMVLIKGDGSPDFTVGISDTVRYDVGNGYIIKATLPVTYENPSQSEPPVDFIAYLDIYSDTVRLEHLQFIVRQVLPPPPEGDLGFNSQGMFIPGSANKGFFSSIPDTANWTVEGSTKSLASSLLGQDTTKFNPYGKGQPGDEVVAYYVDPQGVHARRATIPYRIWAPLFSR